jgi:DNA-binding MarR family transcriptional regulator
MSHLDPLIHAPKRLRIMAILQHSDEVEFQYLRDELTLSVSDLSKQMSALTDAGYAQARKTGKGPGSSTWFRITRAGKAAFLAHVAALRELLDSPLPTTGE